MRFFRFILVCLLAVAVQPSHANFRRGYIPITTNNFRVTMNVDGGRFANLAKAMGFVVLPTQCASPPCTDSNGYPNQTPSVNIGTNPALPAGYYDTFTWSWSGVGAMEDLGGPPVIYTSVSPQGAVHELGNVTSGDVGQGNHNFTCYAANSCGGTGSVVANASIVYQYGIEIQSISNNGTLIHVVTKSNYMGNACWGQSGFDQNNNFGQLTNITGANSNTGANGTWAMTNCGASSFDLVGSTYTNGQASAAGTAVFAVSNLHYYLLGQGAYSNFTNLVIAKTADVQPGGQLANGHYWDLTYVNQLQALENPNGNCVANNDCGWLRFMEFSAVQSNYENDFSQRIPATAISYLPNTWWPVGYWSSSAAGAITNGGASGNCSDAYTTGDPSTSTWSGSAYIQGAVVQGVPSATNSGRSPCLNVGGHGAKPILDYGVGIPPVWLFLNGVPATPGTDTIVFTFSVAGNPSWFNSGSPCVGTYTTQASDTTIGALSGHLDTWFGGGTVGSNPTLTCINNSNVTHGNPQGGIGPIFYPPTAQAGLFSVSYTSVADPTIITVGTMPVSTIGTSGPKTFTYNYLEDAWIYQTGNASGTGFSFAGPMEVAVDLANQVGANAWWNFGDNSSGYVQSVAQIFGNSSTGLTSGLKFGFEGFNEIWNPFAFPYPVTQTLGTTFGITTGSDEATNSYTGLRTAQYGAVASAAWTGQGRSASGFYTFIMGQADNEGVNGNFDKYQLQGNKLNNTFVSSYGALGGGTTAINYSAQGTRPVDAAHVGIGIAPYWASPWWGDVGSNLIGTVSGNAPWLQAQLDYANGSQTTAFTEISNTFNGTTARTDGHTSVGQLMLNVGGGSSNISTMYTSMEAIAAEYDTYRTGAGLSKVARIDYECAPQWGFGTDPVNGTNSATDSASIQALSAKVTSLGWNVGPYILSGQPAISSGTYNNSTGLVTLTLASGLNYSAGSTFTGTSTGNNQVTVASGLTGSITVGETVIGLSPTSTITGQLSGTAGGVGVYTMNQNASGTPTGTGDSITVSSLTGTGAFASLDGTFVTTAGTTSSTITYLASSGLGASTITGGVVYDTTASSLEVTHQTLNFSQAWKNNASYGNLIYTYLYQNLVTISGSNREVHGAQFGYDNNTWGLYPSDYGAGNPYTNSNAIQTQNAGN